MDDKTRLPLDILYTLAESLAISGELSSLKAASLTCKDFHRICESHIFAEVDLTPEDRPVIERFKKLLDTKPEVATFVHVVRVFLDPPHSPDLPIILSSMKAIRRLHLAIRSPSVAWTEIPPLVRSSIETAIRTPTLTHLEIRTLDQFPITQIIAPPLSLTSLVLYSVPPPPGLYSDDLSPTLALSYRAIQLRSLTILHLSMGACLALISQKQSDGSPAVDLRQLEVLNIDMEDKEGLLRLLLEDYERLKCLSICVNRNVPMSGTLNAMKRHTKETLQSLSLELHDVVGEDCDPFLGLCEELNSFPSSSALRRINVQLFVMDDCDCSTRLEDWSAFDEVLQGGKFSLLNDVSLSVNIVRYWNTDTSLETKLKDLAKSAFSRLKHADEIQFRYLVFVHTE
ncbi:unnamed protein product [Cyclocybe aegerita]|uniref:F-box domain-containing protein n=1 Tax=Cyclocybe aegerita TaxID=1973307 RepID=A0A8S0WCS2_CYCAE|nr:unnamed protein product [Cyclocybe aegerita]